ncbi:hypothetical protein BS47DRAFT_1352434 [Hydnum rufescens UP504]|uniref:Transmembrane protein n=1 Tax=Hydnum rufescens UP504 TaxID=1448309 RepID=A0A9P6DQL2_9AGAM|nr:hypothetical protein BS47DRAFT_1352434 [Hydnum rufescens UP504]
MISHSPPTRIDLDVGEQPSTDKQNRSEHFDSAFPAPSALELRACMVSDPPLRRRNPSPQARHPYSPSLTRRILNLRGFTFTATIRIILFALFLRPVLAQAPGNDIISWPSGLLLLASILYAGLGTESDSLWVLDPSIGIFLGNGLPIFSLKAMRRVEWVSNACHFLSDIRSTHGKSNFWIRSNEITAAARAEALKKTSSVLPPVTYKHLATPPDKSLWRLTSEGLIIPANWTPVSPGWSPVTPSSLSIKPSLLDPPSARDFLLFAATDYHLFRDWAVNVYQGDELQFSTLWMPHNSVIDVDSEDKALAVVAAHMVRRPYSQTQLRDSAKNEGSTDQGPWSLNLVGVNLDAPVCAIDFHSYSSTSAKVSASLNELARAYYRVVQHVKQHAIAFDALDSGQLATVNIGQSLWIAILGGELLDKGRVTFQNLPGRRSIKDISADEAYLDRVQAVLEAIEPYANTPKFFDLVFSGGASRWPTYAFLFAGLCGQMIICYFLSVGTVTLANTLYSGRLTDWHTLFFGRTPRTSEPGMKMLVPDAGSKELMVVATFDRSSPRAPQGLTPGLFLNGFGLLAAILGAVFQEQTRKTLGFGPTVPTATWVIYTSITLSLGMSLLILALSILQQLDARTWFDDSERPTRWAIYSTVFPSLVICALAAFFARCRLGHLWPILDALTWLSGLPLGIIENGRMISIDDNYLHLVLVNRWMLGAVASSVGSSLDGATGTTGICWRY